MTLLHNYSLEMVQYVTLKVLVSLDKVQAWFQDLKK